MNAKTSTPTATAHYYDCDTDVALQTRNNKGGFTFTLFESVAAMVNYAREIGVEIVNVITHHDC